MRVRKGGFSLTELLIVVAIIGIIFLSLFRGLLSSNSGFDAVSNVETMGFTEVEVTGSKYVAVGWRGCGDDDSVAYEITAKNPTGNKVNVLMCCGMWLKGCTVRTK